MLKENTLVDQWQERFRANLDVQDYIVPGIGLSYPLLAESADGKRELRYFFHPADQTGVDRLFIASPMIIFIVDPETFAVLNEFPGDALGVPPFEGRELVFDMSQRTQRKARIAELKARYEDVDALYPHQPAGEVGIRFLDMFQAVVPPPLLPYYEAMSPQFFDWLNG